MASKKASEDELWVKSCLAGNKEAFDLLVKKYRDAVYGVAYHYVGDFTEAKDLTQEAFIQAYISLPKLREPVKFGSWLYGIASNVSKMWLRSAKRNVSIEEAKCETKLEDTSAGPLERSERRELKEQVRRALDVLNEKNRLAVTLHYINGYSHKEIANFLDVPVTTIEGRLHRAKKKLRKELLPMVEKDFRQHRLPDDYAGDLAQYVRDLGRRSTWKVRLKAIRALRKAGMGAEEASLVGMSHTDWRVRRWCCYVSWNIVESERVVERLLDDSNKHVRISAMNALCNNHKRIDRDLVPAIIRKLDDENQYVRRWATLALGGVFRDGRATQPLLEKLNDESRLVRNWVCKSLQLIATRSD